MPRVRRLRRRSSDFTAAGHAAQRERLWRPPELRAGRASLASPRQRPLAADRWTTRSYVLACTAVVPARAIAGHIRTPRTTHARQRAGQAGPSRCGMVRLQVPLARRHHGCGYASQRARLGRPLDLAPVAPHMGRLRGSACQLLIAGLRGSGHTTQCVAVALASVETGGRGPVAALRWCLVVVGRRVSRYRSGDSVLGLERCLR